MDVFALALIYLLAAVIAAPLAQRAGLGSVLGDLLAGVFIGPIVGLVGDESEQVMHAAEFGVVMMLFLIGLELKPASLWSMRHRLVGLGGGQVGLTILAAGGVVWALGLGLATSIAVGLVIALSSTAIAMQSLQERGLAKTPGGDAAFSVLLFQDLAFIPMLALLPLLGDPSLAAHGDSHSGGALSGLPPVVQALAILAAVGAIVVGGRYCVGPAFRFIAKADLREIFTAFALLLVLAIAAGMTAVGLSPALGAFVAGVVLSDSEYRHELEADIAPFKGLLLAVFFISVGAGLNFGLVAEAPVETAALVVAVLVGKALVVFALAAAFKMRGADRWLLALSVAQAGEFGFVLIGFGLTEGVFSPDVAGRLSLIVTCSMLLAPGLFILFERVIAPRYAQSEDRPADAIDEPGQAIVAGVGRFGQVVSRLLSANGYTAVVLDHDSALIDNLRRFGRRAWYGDATRPDLLEAAGLKHASVFVAALDDPARQTALVDFVRRRRPNITIIARAYDRRHAYELEAVGATVIHRETFAAALEAAQATLHALGCPPERAEAMAQTFRRHDEESIAQMGAAYREEGMSERYVELARARAVELEKVLRGDEER
ncbi:MAG: cation:proton antiporter [Pseudomonadota bacterium]